MTSLTTRPIFFAAALALLGSSIVSHAQTTFAWVSTNTNNNSLVTAGNYSPSSGVNSDGNNNGVFVFGRSNTTTTNLVTSSGDFKLLTLQFESAAAKGFVLSNSSKFMFEGSTRSIIQGSSFSNNVRSGIKIANGALTLGGDGTGIMVLSSGATADDFGGNGLLKTGSSSFFLDKAFNITVTISNGTLAYRTNNAIGQIQLRGGVLATTGTFSRTLGTTATSVNFGAGGGGFAAYGGALTVSTALSNWGSTANSLSNGTALILGSRIADNVVTLSSALNLGGAAGTNRVIQLVDNTNSAADAAVISGAISGAANLVLGGAGTLSLSASNSYANTVISNGVALKIGTNGTTGTLGTGNVTNNGALIFHRSNDLTASNAISGTGVLDKQGAGTVTLTGANTYTGTTTISAGALQVGAGGTAGALGTNNVTNNGALIFNRSDNVTAANVISGTGALSKLGAGTVTLTGANTYSGTTTIGAGALKVGDNGTTGTLGAGNVTNNGTLIFHRSDNLTASNAISGTGALSKLGAGTLTVTGANTYTGTTTIGAGALQVGAGGTAGALGTNNVTNNGALIFNRSDNVTAGNVISGTGALSKLGAGTLTLSASNSYSGGTFLNAGALIAGNVFAFGSGSITLTNGTLLNLSNLSVTNLLVNNGGTLTNLGTVSGAELNGGTTTIASSNSTVAEVSGTAQVTVAGVNTTITNVAGGTVSIAGTNTTLQTVEAGTLNVAGTNTTVQTLNGGTVNVTNGTTVVVQSGSTAGTIGGGGGLVKNGTNALILSGNNTFTGGAFLNEGTLRLASTTAAGGGSITQSNGSSRLVVDTTGTLTNQMSVFYLQSLQTVTLLGNKTLFNAIYDITNNTTTTESGTLTGSGGITKLGTGTLVVTASNTFTGAVDVQAGVLNLNSSTGFAAGSTTNVSVASGAILLVSQSNQVNNAAPVTLSGGTIQRASGVSEVFGSLNLTTSSFLDFSGGAGGTLTFNGISYTPSALRVLDIANFNQGSSLVFQTTNNLSLSGFTFSGTGGFGSSSFNGTTFTITAIPEPSTYLAAAALLGLMLWPSRRRLLKDAQKILGLRAPMRDRLAALRSVDLS